MIGKHEEGVCYWVVIGAAIPFHICLSVSQIQGAIQRDLILNRLTLIN
jgi:hypothetical protein